MEKKKVRIPFLSSGIAREKFSHFKFIKTGKSESDSLSISPSRFLPFTIITVLIFLIFLLRLFYLTIVSGQKNRQLADNNRIRLAYEEPLRGTIFDRNGQVLSKSQRHFFLNSPTTETNQNATEITENQSQDLEKEGLASENFEGSLGKITQEIQRVYPLGKITSHVLGYTSIIQEADLKTNPQLTSADFVGRLGVEQSYDSFLRGTSGKKLIEVNSTGQKISILGKVDPHDGQNLYLTIDSQLQKVAWESLKKQAQKVASGAGAVIAQNPQTGEILALVSLPGFDAGDIGKFQADSLKPFFNRAISGTYPPGSIFKIVSALAGLESGKITSESQIEDVGEFQIAGSRFSNWYFNQYGQRDGVLKIDKAIARSNDIFFYKLAQQIGLDELRLIAKKLGFGQKTGIDITGEAYGLVPDQVWKKSTLGQDWFLGDTLHLSIGQGFMLATPLQISSLISFIATGIDTKPYLVSKIASVQSQTIEPQHQISDNKKVAKANLQLVRQGMREACQTGGTGWPFFDAPYPVACKTGTAEKELGNPHAWFSAFAPAENPQIAITVLIEDGGEGSSVAGPVAREILDWYFKNRVKS